ncbi:hypothetical protein BGW38_010918 [Lunasporangiospora selenospora]|uniref:FAD/NAD(P)-binding domain-containing protein n=1 Tax=Lunasporangiospora selenospora TaxID=979761 RepID=A0A9P6FXU0_9FUNG|nr:hypothetical protein BGW38_010918 [Lunasporangiospora selenospora]
MSESDAPIKIVVVGGSYAGITVIKQLLSSSKASQRPIQIILVDKRDARHHSLGAFRAVVDGEFGDRIWISYKKLFSPDSLHKVIQGQLKQVHLHHIVLASGEEVGFDYLVLCTGSSNPSPAKFNDINSSRQAIEITNQVRKDLEKHQNIVVIGGGACGVELAGEIKSAYGDQKTVSLIHASSKLVDYPGYGAKFKAHAHKHLESLGAHVYLNERVAIEGLTFEDSIQVAPRTVRLSTGKVIESDMQFLCAGNKVDTSYILTLKPETPVGGYNAETLIDPNTQTIKVKKTGQVDCPGLEHIFAVGDCSNIAKVATAAACSYTCPTVAKNIIAVANFGKGTTHGRKPALSNVQLPPAIMCLATGPTTGVVELPLLGTIGSNFISRAFKSKDFMIGRTMTEMNIA